MNAVTKSLFQISFLFMVAHPAHAELTGNEESYPQVLYFVGNSKRQTAMISTSGLGKITEGTIIETFRLLGSERKANHSTGKMKIIKSWQSRSLAAVIEENNDSNTSRGYQHFGIMAGDLLRIKKINIAKISIALPTIVLSYFDLFVDPNESPSTYELSDQGKASLDSQIDQFRNKRLSRIFIGGHTDRTGSKDENQIESYQRAMTIKQHLINSLGFDSERLTALGFGESDPSDRSNVLGQRRKNRRIEIKASSL